jgi:transmembrane sensor
LIDTPPVDKATAWRLGQVDLANFQLADAAAEMNRYSNTKVVIEDPRTAAIRITGVFRAGDSASFANAIADTYGLGLRPSPGRIVIVGSPRD